LLRRPEGIRPWLKEQMMKKTMIASLAVISVFAATATAFAYGPGPRGGMGYGPGPGAAMDPAVHAERVQARLDDLKAALKLQPEQVAAWDAYEAKLKAEAQTRAQLRQSMWQTRDDAQAFADQRVTMMKHNAQAADEINHLRKALYASLSDEQKATFDQYSVGPRFARGPGGGQGGFGPGDGPRGGGRGPGFGRGGCLGMS